MIPEACTLAQSLQSTFSCIISLDLILTLSLTDNGYQHPNSGLYRRKVSVNMTKTWQYDPGPGKEHLIVWTQEGHLHSGCHGRGRVPQWEAGYSLLGPPCRILHYTKVSWRGWVGAGIQPTSAPQVLCPGPGLVKWNWDYISVSNCPISWALLCSVQPAQASVAALFLRNTQIYQH